MRIGTRGSRLALFQANAVSGALTAAGHGPCEIVVVRTTGDQPQITANERRSWVSDAGGKRLFVKEIEEALLAGEVDLAVHSAKDMPVDLPAGLGIGAVLPREDPRDAIVLPDDRRHKAQGKRNSDEEVRVDGVPAECLAPNAYCLLLKGRIGTGSIRRIAQLRLIATGNAASFEPVRGNVDTRLGKLDAGEYDALVLAAAGLRRLGFGDRISALLPVAQCVPAPGQGAIAVEVRTDDERASIAVGSFNDVPTALAVEAERAVVETIGGGCQLPLGAIALAAGGGDLELHAVVMSPDGARIARARARGPASRPRQLGRQVADQLTLAGARDILDALRT